MNTLTKAERKEIRKQERHEWEAKLEKEQQTKKYKQAAIWIVGSVLSILALWGLITLVNTPAAPPKLDIKQPPLTKNDMSKGPKDAKVTIVEYADFQCPSCKAYHPIIEKLMKEFDGKLRIIYRFFPLQTIHPNATVAAQAAYAAHLQGKFWHMHTVLFEQQQDWSNSTDAEKIFIDYAKKFGLNREKFQQDFAADATKKFIEEQVNTGSQAGISGTPTFFINGKQIENPRGYEAFKEVIEKELKI